MLVVGANGFIGSHVVEILARSGYHVRAFDRFRRPPQFDEHANIEVVPGDLQNHAQMKTAVEGADSVVHALSFSTPASSEGDPTFDVRTNVVASIDLLDACRNAGVRTFYFMSSGGTVYGQTPSAARETDHRAPRSPYGIGKSTIEDYVAFYAREWGMRGISMRISNPYGPRQLSSRQGLVSIILRRLLAREPLLVMGDGSMIRDYIEITDLAKMIVNLITADHLKHDVYNLGSGVGRSVNEVIATAATVTGYSPATTNAATPRGFVDYSVLDISRYAREFGTPNLIDLNDGMTRLWQRMKA